VTQPTINLQALETLIGKVVSDVGAAMNASLTVVGDQLGLYRALAECDGLSPEQLAERTGTQPRYVREWLSAQAASGYVTYTPETERFSLSPEQVAAFANEGNPAFVVGGFQIAQAVSHAIPRAIENFKSGQGMAWGDHAHCLFHGTERFFRSAYIGHLTTDWLPALDGVVERLEADGAKVADVGCGLGASTLLMAKAFPKARFVGFDAHPRSITLARERAALAGLSDRVEFEVGRATDFPGSGYDLVAHFDSLHDMGDPVGAARHVRSTLAPGGSWMIVEPFSNDRLEDNFTPVGRVNYAASTFLCVPASLADGGPKLALGAQAGESRLRRVASEGGFTSFHRATQTPFNLVFQARG
jgi:2-polyprenyl-3-methyl-5-hydroxy-6-metoxy-1,4-benzoquinol methylase